MIRMNRWNGRIALVTGASVGIGAEICRQLVKYGLNVVGCARTVNLIQAIADEDSVKASPGSILPIKCDLQKESDILEMFEEIRKTFGHLDICINNAGLSHHGDLLTGSTDDWRSMLDVNVLALSICTREAVKLMREKNINDGQVIQISSMAGHRIPLSGANFYSGTKFMVKALTEGLRRELRTLKSHIRVSCISPGLVETQFAYRSLNDTDKAGALYDSIECLQAKDIAEAVVFILQSPPHVDINEIMIRPTEQAQ